MEAFKGEFLPEELVLKVADLTGRINREIAVYMDRKGRVIDVSIGDSATVTLSEVEGRRSNARLSGVRCLHTHPNGDPHLSMVDISSLLNLRMDAMVAVGVKSGSVTGIYAAVPKRDANGAFTEAEIYGPYGVGDDRMNALFEIISGLDKDTRRPAEVNDNRTERAILVGLETSREKMINSKSQGERSLEELEELAHTAGVIVVHKILQRRQMKDPAFYIGRGMVEQLSLLRQELNADVLIFDDELSGAQVRNIEELAGARVVDRTTLILDIFAQRARSREGKLQVELAQLKYRLPRLMGLGGQLSRLGGGIGTRGPGEKKLETDRRHIRRRIRYLEGELEVLNKRRSLIREGRHRNSMPVIALVGYTNAGKSTLMNKLCGTDVFAEDKLFATLDPTTRSLTLQDGREVLLTDTVGFIRKLPHELVEAFKSTLEEAVYADMLIHVVDASSEEAEEQIAVVNDLLRSLGALDKPVILALNKMDLAGEQGRMPVAEAGDRVFEISAATGQGLDKLLEGIASLMPADEINVEVLAPYDAGWVLPYIHQNGRVLSQDYTETGIKVNAMLKSSKIERINDYII
ncbi:GTPase HflX [Clostridium thermosuccinogenes]|uniref:GTPase HflX n=1 Tax=Clostridium thermosuccinogenes TaxID=84032 RepID=A0A2K2FIL5_9CLOT|nr:GTPase HflX [Pseudoclostridium thermosuccinogenes]PNT91686.1 GTPase HflX [Pseudoclostridium thermosuccinogenes]PNT96795.1 GTPase HflX [Pseudoclostridium thermosuccinogenes]PNT98632.1 GTPase HflX [Pseudoclostridium thermosuccinogenes]